MKDTTAEDRGVLFRHGNLGNPVLVVSGLKGSRTGVDFATMHTARAFVGAKTAAVRNPVIYERSADGTWTQSRK